MTRLANSDSPERQALLRAVCLEPTDLTSRLIYADYLEEYGDEKDQAQASYIRQSIELIALPTCPSKNEPFDHILCRIEPGCKVCQLRQDSQAILEEHAESWLRHLPGEFRQRVRHPKTGEDYYRIGFLEDYRVVDVLFAGGLIDSVCLSIDLVTTSQTELRILFSSWPISSLRCLGCHPWGNGTFASFEYPYGFEASLTWHIRETYKLPPVIWNLLDAPYVDEKRVVKSFKTELLAYQELDAATLDYCRMQADLPPLNPKRLVHYRPSRKEDNRNA